MADDTAAALAEISQAIARDVLSSEGLSGTEWDTYSLVGEVSDSRVALVAYRYAPTGAPIPTEVPDVYDLLSELRDRTRGDHGETWDLVLVKIDRATAELAMTFLSGADAAMWRVRPQNMGHLAESLRPRPDDFASG